MTEETVRVSATINAPAETVFRVLADPTTHEAIDGTGWVRESLDGTAVTGTDQIFRMAMYHDNHPDGRYEIANIVRVFEPPRAIAWEPGQDGPDGDVEGGGWIWRYDLSPTGADRTEVVLTYDWSAVPAETRQEIPFPPFELSHLDNSLQHLAGLVEKQLTPGAG
jgi:uncharacterized protein YndB with AHSA1/START domain